MWARCQRLILPSERAWCCCSCYSVNWAKSIHLSLHFVHLLWLWPWVHFATAFAVWATLSPFICLLVLSPIPALCFSLDLYLLGTIVISKSNASALAVEFLFQIKFDCNFLPSWFTLWFIVGILNLKVLFTSVSFLPLFGEWSRFSSEINIFDKDVNVIL